MGAQKYNERPQTTPVTLDRLFAHANPTTGIADTAPLSALASLFAGVAPSKPYGTIAAMLANTDLPQNYFAFVADASADSRASAWALYIYAGGDRASLGSYTFVSTQSLVRKGVATGLDAYAVTVAPSGVLVGLGQVFNVKIPATSTGAATLNVNGGGALKIFKNPTTQAGAGDLTADQHYPFVFDPALDSSAGGYLMMGGGTSGASGLGAVLSVDNDAGGLQIKNLANASAAQDAVTLSQMTAAITAAVTGLLDYRGGFDASVNAYPSTGGSGTAGAILKADTFVVTVAGTLPTGRAVEVGDWLVAKVDTPGNTEANWDVIEHNVVLATSSVAGILKLYTTVGGNTDGTITQAAITAALNLKSDRKWSITTKTGSYTLAAAELTALGTGTSLVMEGNSTGDLTVPLNSTVAFEIGDNLAVRGFNNIVATGGVTVTGTNGTLVVPLGRTVILEKIGTNNWLLHNGSAVVSTWSTTALGVVEESTQAEAENIATGASTTSTTGISQGRTASELGLYHFIRKIVTLGWTWTVAQIFSIGPTISDATASTPAWFNASKKLVTAVVTDFLDWLGINPISVAVSLSSTTITLDFNSKYSRKFHTTAAHTANFSLVKANKTLLEYGHYNCLITGTVVVQLDSDDRMPDDAIGWNYASKQLTIVSGGTGLGYSIVYSKLSNGNFYVTCSSKITQ